MTYAADREDLWLLDQFPAGYQGHAVELGAHDGTFISCTRLLEERGWKTLCIEPNPRHHEALRASRKLVLGCACAAEPKATRTMYEYPGFPYNSLVRPEGDSSCSTFEIPVLTLDQCLAISGFKELDVLVLDVDGEEPEILAGFSLDRWRPKAVVLEVVKWVGTIADVDDATTSGPLEHFLANGYQQVERRIANRLLLRSEWS